MLAINITLFSLLMPVVALAPSFAVFVVGRSVVNFRGAANGVVWAIAYFVGFVLWPFVTVALQQSTGSFALAFPCIPGLMIGMAAGVWLSVPEHAGKELNTIIV